MSIPVCLAASGGGGGLMASSTDFLRIPSSQADGWQPLQRRHLNSGFREASSSKRRARLANKKPEVSSTD